MNLQSSDSHVLVTGGAGFVGARLVEALSTSGRRVTAVDVVDNDRSASVDALPGTRYVQLDLRDRPAARAALDGVTHVVHLAAVRSKSSDANPRLSHEVNVDATYDLFANAAAAGVERIVFGSSHTVYGGFPDPLVPPYREQDTGGTGRGLGMYAATKLAAEAYLEAFANAGGCAYLSLRFGTIYGPRVSEGSNGTILLDMLRAVDAGETPSVPWARDARHGLTHVDDVVTGCVRALDCDNVNLAVNVVGDPVSSEDIYGTLIDLYGGDRSTIAWLEEKTRYQSSDPARRKALLGIHDTMPLNEGLQGFIDWYREEHATA